MTVTRPFGPHPTPAGDSEVELFSVAGHDGFLREVNERFAGLLGVDTQQLLGRSVLELVHPEDVGAIVAGLAALSSGSAEVVLESRFRQQGGSWVHLQWVARPLPGTDLWWAAGRDTTAFHRLLSDGVDLRARLDLAIGKATAAMWELDARQGRLTWEAQAAPVLGVTLESLPDTVAELADVVHAEDAAVVTGAVAELLETGITEVAVRVHQQAGVRHLSLRGKVLDRDRRGRPIRAVGLLFDVTNDKAMEEQMLRMIMSDALTGAPNRRAFDQALRAEWRRCSRSQEPLSVVMIDIDDFKQFNDTFGHLVGDEVLCAVSRALTAGLMREGDTVARFGGEEFAAVLPGVDSAGALTVADRLREAVRGITIRQAPGWTLSISIGTATWNSQTGPHKTGLLLSRADEALYVAKSSGKDRAVAYEDSLAERAELEDAIRHGLATQEFEMFYQPIVSLQAGHVTGFEALMRWNRRGQGRIAPDVFIPVAELSSLICDLGRFALNQATWQLSAWLEAGLDPAGTLRMAVNASGRHIAGPEIVTDVRDALTLASLPPHRLELELTETALVDGALVESHLAQVRALGVSISLDDFGTGYTSIGQLPHLPVDTLKIDRSFISTTDPRQAELVTLMIGAARAFDLSIVAEGIEDEPILDKLRMLGCDDAQGYLMAKPMPAAAVPGWLAQWSERSNRLGLSHAPAGRSGEVRTDTPA